MELQWQDKYDGSNLPPWASPIIIHPYDGTMSDQQLIGIKMATCLQSWGMRYLDVGHIWRVDRYDAATQTDATRLVFAFCQLPDYETFQREMDRQ